MGEVKINLNELVWFKLTDHGKDLYYHQNDRFIELNPRAAEILKPRMPAVDSDGYSQMALWQFMELYGPHMHMGSQDILKPLEIVYRRSARVMDWKLVKDMRLNCVAWLEDVGKRKVIPGIRVACIDSDRVGFVVCDATMKGGHVIYPASVDYGERWRCWNAEPTMEERMATAWKR